MRQGIILILSFLLLVPSALAATSMEKWPYYKKLDISQGGMTLVELDQEILKEARQDLGDLRLTNAQGQEVPYLIRTAALLDEQTYQGVSLLNQVVKGHQRMVTFSLGKPRLSNNIGLEVVAKDAYLCEVQIEGSTDNQTWHVIAQEQIYTVTPQVTDTRVAYPDVDFPYVRVTVDTNGQDLKFKGGTIGYRPAENKTPGPLPVEILERTEQEKYSDLVLALSTKGYAVHQILLEVNGRNYQREVEVYTSNDKEDWQLIGAGRIYDHQWQAYQATDNTLEVGQILGRYIKLHIVDQDSPPLDVQNLQVLGELPKILVDLPLGINTLWYGNGKAEQPQYDLSQFAHLINDKEFPILKLGAQEKNPSYQPPRKPWTEEHRWLLNGVVLLLAVTLGFIILKLMRKTT